MDFAIQYGLDIALLAVLVFKVIWHAQKGFVHTVLTLLAVILSFGLALAAAEPVASWSYDLLLDQTVCETIDKHAKDFNDAHDVQEIVDEVAETIPAYLGQLFEKIDIDLNEVSRQIGSANVKTVPTSQQLSQQVVKPAAMVVLKTIVTILLYILIMAVFRLIIRLICKATKLPVLHTADKTLGGVLGFLQGFVLVYLVAMLCGLVGQVTSKPEAKQVIDHSKIVTICQQITFSGDAAD